MNKKAWLIAALSLQLVSVYSVAAATSGSQVQTATISVDGKAAALQKQAVLHQQKTYVLAQDAANILKAKWTLQGQTGQMKVGNHTIAYQLDSGAVTVDGKAVQGGEAALLRGKDVYVPLRWLVEQAGQKIAWNAEKRAVEIVSSGQNDSFVLVDEKQLTEAEQEFVESVKGKQGIHQQGDLYVIARGQSPHPGYGLQVTKVQQSWEQLLVYVKLTEPVPGMMYPQVITYPYLTAKVKLPPYNTIVFIDADTNKPLFEGAQSNQ